MVYSKDIQSLLEQGAKAYASKNYESAVEFYGDACGKASEAKGEEDAELLYLYGKALFHVAISKNGLFGGEDEQPSQQEQQQTGEEPVDEDSELRKGKESGMFQFSEDVPLADEEDDDCEEQEEEQEQDNEEYQGTSNTTENEEKSKEEEQSDFEIAWEILDLSRSLFEQKLQDLDNAKLEILEKPEESKEVAIQTRIKLADIHDLLGEISLETENFKQAAEDLKIVLKLRQGIYKFNSNLISEAHYKLSLALEFNFENGTTKDEAVHHLKEAIESIKKRDVKDEELVKELELKLEELSRDPSEQSRIQKEEILKGILGEATSKDKTSSIPQPTTAGQSTVNDLTSMVKKRKPKVRQDLVSKKPKTK